MADRITWAPNENATSIIETGKVEDAEITLTLSRHYLGDGYTIYIRWWARSERRMGARPTCSDYGRKAPYSTVRGVKAWAEKEVERVLRARSQRR